MQTHAKPNMQCVLDARLAAAADSTGHQLQINRKW
jgi:hypothetical protein